MRVYLQNGQVKFVYEGQRVNVTVTETKSEVTTEADLDMFSMFGRTGAPTKRGPKKHNFFHFLQHGNKPEILK